MNVTKLNWYLGDVNVGDYIVYFKDGKISDEFRKGIWKVTEVYIEKVDLTAIASPSKFTTSRYNCLNVDYLFEHLTDKEIKEYITEASLNKYNTIKNAYGTWVKELPADWVNEQWNKLYASHSARQMGKSSINNLNKEIKQMNGTMNNIISNNSEAAKIGAKIAAGKTLNSVLRTRVVEQLPRKYRRLSKHPLADVVVANVASFAVQNFARNNINAIIATEAMMQAAMTDLISSFNFEQVINEVLAGINIEDLKE